MKIICQLPGMCQPFCEIAQPSASTLVLACAAVSRTISFGAGRALNQSGTQCYELRLKKLAAFAG
jgi:hypothetical protein